MGKWLGVVLIGVRIGLYVSGAEASQKTSHPWVTGYYLGQWIGAVDSLQPEQIDYSALTHLVFFGAFPKKDGSLELLRNKVISSGTGGLLQRTHGAGVKVLLSLGSGELNEAVSEKSLPVLLENLKDLFAVENFDGLDVDWEPLQAEEGSLYSNFIHQLRVLLGPQKLLTAATIDEPEVFALIQDNFDQINLMTYDLSGRWLGMTWHNSALFGTNVRGERLNSVDDEVRRFRKAGVQSSKLGVGLEFYGYTWTGGTSGQTPVTGPRQSWDVEPQIDDSVSYASIMEKYFQKNSYHWDFSAQVPYLSLANKDGDPVFVSYENARSCRAKMKYVKNKKLGGLMIWELGGDWTPKAKISEPLLDSIKKAKDQYFP